MSLMYIYAICVKKWFISEITMFAIMTLFVHLYISQSVELDIRSSLSRQVTSLSENIINYHGSLRIDESKIEKQYPNMYIAVIDGKGNILWGSVPDGVSIYKSTKSVCTESYGIEY